MTVKAKAPTAAPVLNETDTVIKATLERLAATGKAVAAATPLFTLARTLSWAAEANAGSDVGVIADAWTVKSQTLAHPFYGVATGAALLRWGFHATVSPVSDDVRAFARQSGTPLVADHVVSVHLGNETIDSAAFVKSVRALCNTTEIAATGYTGSAVDVVRQFLAADSLTNAQAKRNAWLKSAASNNQSALRDKQAVAALASVTAKPSSDLRKELERLLAL